MTRSAPDLTATGLLTERRVEPLGIDARRPRLSWRLESGVRALVQRAYQVQAASTEDELDSGRGLLWDSGREESAETEVQYAGHTLESRQVCHWRVRVWSRGTDPSPWSAPSRWEMGLLAPQDWSADWITWRAPDLGSDPYTLRLPLPAPILRRTFACAADVVRARLYITALGLYDAEVNGQRVGERWLSPGWTDYHQRVEYQVFDVGDLLKRGQNELSVVLGDGWYCGHVSEFGRCIYGDTPALLCQLEMEFDRGPEIRVVSDTSWLGRDSEIRTNDLLNGERVDRRLSDKGGSRPWEPVVRKAPNGAALVASRDEGIRVIGELAARKTTQMDPATRLVDFGQNLAGVVRIQVRGGPGESIVVRHGEALTDDGQLYVANLAHAKQRDEYVLDGSGPATLTPRFTYHGFRYAEVSGGTLERATALALSSASRTVGTFETSEPLINALQSNILWSLRSNFVGLPTDCPQRDERMGWTGDIAIIAPTALFNVDVTNILKKWLVDLSDAQLPSGAYPDIAPQVGYTGWGNTAWADCGVTVPWHLYERSGDRQVLDDQYDSMLRYLRYLAADTNRGARFGGWYGDWLCWGEPTPKDLLGTAYVFHVAGLFARIARLLDRTTDVSFVERLREDARRSFARRFLGAGGRLAGDTQTAYAIALAFGLIPERLRPEAARRLAALVKAADDHIHTGFVGVAVVLQALSDHGYHDLACRVIRQVTVPSWGYQIQNGATTTWERWDGWTKEAGFSDPGMNSFNHFGFGSVGDWLYRYVGALDPAEPGYRRITVRPRLEGGIKSALTRHESLHGPHVVAWQVDGDQLTVDLSVPANTTAEVVMPGRGEILLDELPLERSSWARRIRSRSGGTSFTVGSGDWRVRSQIGVTEEK